MRPPNSYTDELKEEANRLGFRLSGVTAAATPGRLRQFQDWLDAGYAAGMLYLLERQAAYSHPRHVLEGCRTIVMLAVPYDSSVQSSNAAADTGKIARYARGEIDYHDVVHPRLKQLKRWIHERYPQAKIRGVVDTAPLLEREFAESAGLGWVGKNTLLLNREWGSYFFLAALLTDLELKIDSPYPKGYCGTCTACLDACPTNAFPAPFVLDANRCISYLTIEHRGNIPEDLRGTLDGWLFGCDVCQEVCPWNRYEKPTDDAFVSQYSEFDLIEILGLDETQFRQRFRKTPFWRSRREGMLRNAMLLCVSQQLAGAVPSLRKLTGDSSSQIRSVAEWALRRLSSEASNL